jgi:exopolysaccharide production protein ExoQ
MSAWVDTGGTRRDRANARTLRLVDEQVVERQWLEAEQPEMAWKVGPLRIDADGLFAFLLFLPLLFMARLGPAGAAIFAGLTPLYVWIRRERLGRVMGPRAFLLLVPALALFSTVWSQAPQETFKGAVEFAITAIVGLLISSARNPTAVIKGLAAAFFAYVLASVLFGGRVAVGVGAGGYAFAGLSGSKNLLGDIASTGFILALAAILLGFRRKQPQWVLLGLAAGALDLYVVAATRSAGAMLGLGLGAAAMTLLTPLLVAGRVVRGWLTATVALCLIAAGLSYRWLTETLIEMGARIFDKDPTLTGRTYLWYRAEDLIREKPGLGRGFEAFWVRGNIDAEGLWRYFGIHERGGFTFHNTAVELLVSLGWFGLIFTAAVVLAGGVFLVRKFVLRPSIALVCWISILLYQVARMPIETIGLAPFYFSTALTFACLGAGFGRVKAPRRVRAQHPQAPPGMQLRLVDYAAPGWTDARAATGGRRQRR